MTVEASKYLTKDRQKQRNLADILRFIVEKNSTTRREIQRETGFSWGTVSESVAELILRGYVFEQMPSEKNVGRTSTILRLCGDSIASVGIDINISGITARVIGFDKSKIWKAAHPYTAKSQSELLSDAICICKEAFAFCKDKFKVISIGIAMQGTVDTESGISVRFPNIPEWQAIDIKKAFQNQFGVATTVEHDPKCLLFAKNSSDRLKDAMLLRIDNGIGLSVIQDGKILNDFGKMELGHTVAVRGGARCSCGKDGCLEAYSSIIGIERQCGKSYAEILTLSDSEIYREAAAHLGRAIYNLCMLFAPEKIILTGILSENVKFTDTLKEELSCLGFNSNMIEIDNNISASMGAALISVMNLIKSSNI